MIKLNTDESSVLVSFMFKLLVAKEKGETPVVKSIALDVGQMIRITHTKTY